MLIEPEWLAIARPLVAQKEIKGPKHNPVIVALWESIKSEFADDETAWCAAFVGACLERAGVQSTRSGMARSYSRFGVNCNPVVGAIVVLSRPGNAASGHVGFAVGRSADSKTIYVLGGNQGDAVSIAGFAAQRVVALRWPGGTHAADPKNPLPVMSGPNSKSEA